MLIVMLSRARHGLVISRAHTRVSKAGRTYSPDPCPWMRAILAGGALDADAVRAHIDSLPPGHSY